MTVLPNLDCMLFRVLTILIGLMIATLPARAQSSHECEGPSAFDAAAFERPMEFTFAHSRGNISTSIWIAAIGTIESETPERLRAFLATEEFLPGQIILHSPGGNLLAGLELGRVIREAGLTAYVGRTVRYIESHAEPCDTWFDGVEAGVCASSCAYAFLGGVDRFLSSANYRTEERNQLGFHQFFASANFRIDMLSTVDAASVEAAALSSAQLITGAIVLYAIEMGVDPRIVALASGTPSDEMFFPSENELLELGIVSGDGMRPWLMDPYNGGLVAATTPYSDNTMLQQITAFCDHNDGAPRLLITMELQRQSHPADPEDLPLISLDLHIDSERFAIERRLLDVRYSGNSILLSAPVGQIRPQILGAQQIRFSLSAPRSMGGFWETSYLDDYARAAMDLAWRNCI